MHILPKARLVLALLVVGVPAAGAAVHGAPVAGSWRRLPAAPIRVDAALTSAWTGKELVVFGRRSHLDHPVVVDGTPQYWTNAAAAYDPAARRWRRLSPPSVVDTAGGATAVWTGRFVVIVQPFHTFLYDPATDRWRVVGRGHGGLVVWTGHEVLAWGGGCCGDVNADGVSFTPSTGRWRALPRSPLAGSQSPVGAWDGQELVLVVAGKAAEYIPRSREWLPIWAPPRFNSGALAVRAGARLFVLGGSAEAFVLRPKRNAAWDPIAPLEEGRSQAVAVWTGKLLLVWGGVTGPADPPRVPAHGLAYSVGRDAWLPLPPAPLRGRIAPTGAWTGHSFLVWGGSLGTRTFADGAAFTPATP